MLQCGRYGSYGRKCRLHVPPKPKNAEIPPFTQTCTNEAISKVTSVQATDVNQ